MSNNITTLRQHLFDALERISNASTIEAQQLEAEKACSLVQISEAILETVKVEANLIQNMKQSGSGFILIEKEEKKTPIVPNNQNRLNGSIKTHQPDQNHDASPVHLFEEELIEEEH
jgi:hypothetical protein